MRDAKYFGSSRTKTLYGVGKQMFYTGCYKLALLFEIMLDYITICLHRSPLKIMSDVSFPLEFGSRGRACLWCAVRSRRSTAAARTTLTISFASKSFKNNERRKLPLRIRLQGTCLFVVRRSVSQIYCRCSDHSHDILFYYYCCCCHCMCYPAAAGLVHWYSAVAR